MFNTFCTLPFTLLRNQSECLNLLRETNNASKLTLIDAVYDDVADSVIPGGGGGKAKHFTDLNGFRRDSKMLSSANLQLARFRVRGHGLAVNFEILYL